MADEIARRAPVNGVPYGTIAWAEHVRAWECYARHWSGQDAETIAARGGFGICELVAQLGHLPVTWEPSNATRVLDDAKGYRPEQEGRDD